MGARWIALEDEEAYHTYFRLWGEEAGIAVTVESEVDAFYAAVKEHTTNNHPYFITTDNIVDGTPVAYTVCETLIQQGIPPNRISVLSLSSKYRPHPQKLGVRTIDKMEFVKNHRRMLEELIKGAE